MNVPAFTYHALRSVGWWARAWASAVGCILCPFDNSLWISYGLSGDFARVAWVSARRALGRDDSE